MEASTSPDLSERGQRVSWAVRITVAVVGLFALLCTSIVFVLVFPWEPIAPTEPPPLDQPSVPKIDYQALVNAETVKASAQSQQLVAAFRVSIENFDAEFAKQLPVAAYNASASAATYKSILSLISHLAWDKAKGTNESESYLASRIEPSIGPAVNEFRLNLNSETAKLDNELRKVTVQLAGNIAAIGPGDSRPPRVVSQENTMPEFQTILKHLGRSATGNSFSIGLSVVDLVKPNMLSSLISPVRKIALQMFGKPIARLAVLPFVAEATGPIPIGAVIAVAGLLYTGYDIYRMQADFENQVFIDLKTRLDGIRNMSKTSALNFATSRAQDIQKIQAEIGSQALKSLEKQETR